MNLEESKSDKIVFIRRLPLSNSEKNSNEETQEYFNQGNRHVGSFHVKDSIRPGSGLTLPEENLLMPLVIDIDPADRLFRQNVSKFFHEIYLKIPPHDPKRNVGGLKLNISLQDDSKKLGENLGDDKHKIINLPKFPADYVKWKFCMAHPLVARSEKDGGGNLLKEFYIFDETVVKKENASEQDLKDNAMKAYLTIKDDSEKVLQMLIVLNVPREEYLGKESIVLRKQAEVNPKDFMTYYKSKHTENVALLKELIEARIIERAGDRFTYTETKELFAIDEKDAMGYLQDPANSESVLAFKSKIQKFRKEKNAM